MNLETAKLLKRVLDILYPNCVHYAGYELRIIYRIDRDHAAYDIELKIPGETMYFEDEDSVLYHIGEVLDKK